MCCVTAGEAHRPLGPPAFSSAKQKEPVPALPCLLGSFSACENSLVLGRPGKWKGCSGYFWGRLVSPFPLLPFPLSPSVLPVPSLQAGPSGSHQPGMLPAVRVSGEGGNPFGLLCFLLDISLEYSGRCQQGAVAPHTWTPALCFCTTPVPGRWRRF